jgi:hypothetical protein
MASSLPAVVPPIDELCRKLADAGLRAKTVFKDVDGWCVVVRGWNRVGAGDWPSFRCFFYGGAFYLLSWAYVGWRAPRGTDVSMASELLLSLATGWDKVMPDQTRIEAQGWTRLELDDLGLDLLEVAMPSLLKELHAIQIEFHAKHGRFATSHSEIKSLLTVGFECYIPKGFLLDFAGDHAGYTITAQSDDQPLKFWVGKSGEVCRSIK